MRKSFPCPPSPRQRNQIATIEAIEEMIEAITTKAIAIADEYGKEEISTQLMKMYSKSLKTLSEALKE
jgi:hypothetical protein